MNESTATKEYGLLSARDVSFAYSHEPVLHEISLEIQPGEFLGVIGPNGSGKSTLLKILAGILKPDRKTVFFKNADISSIKRKELASSVSWIPQENPMVFSFTVLDVVMMGRHPYMSPLMFESDEDYQVAHRAMEMTGTSQFAQRLFNEISSGERQRVIIASSIAQEPEIMLLDEPTSALDIKYQLEILKILKRLNHTKNMTVVMAIHDLHLASKFCDRLVLLKNGKIFADGAPAEILQKEILEEVYDVKINIFTGHDGTIMVSPEM